MIARRSRPHQLATAVAAIALAAGLAACSGDDDGGSAGDFSVEDALGELPPSTLEDEFMVTITDLDRATELAGLERPDAEPSEDELLDWILPLTGVPRDRDGVAVAAAILPEASNPARAREIDEFRDEVGWALTDVAWFVEMALPPARFTVLHGDFDVAAIDDAIGERDDEIWSIGGDDFEQDVSEVSAARPFGQALRLAEDDGALAVSASTPPIEEWLDGDRVDDDGLRAVAQALDEHHVYTAILLDGESMTLDTSRLSPEQIEIIEQDLLRDFDAFGAALTVVDGDAIGVLAFHHASASDAEANGERLEHMFDDGRSGISGRDLSEMFDDVEVTVDGEVVTVTFQFVDDAPPSILWNAVYARDTFLTHR